MGKPGVRAQSPTVSNCSALSMLWIVGPKHNRAKSMLILMMTVITRTRNNSAISQVCGWRRRETDNKSCRVLPTREIYAMFPCRMSYYSSLTNQRRPSYILINFEYKDMLNNWVWSGLDGQMNGGKTGKRTSSHGLRLQKKCSIWFQFSN